MAHLESAVIAYSHHNPGLKKHKGAMEIRNTFHGPQPAVVIVIDRQNIIYEFNSCYSHSSSHLGNCSMSVLQAWVFMVPISLSNGYKQLTLPACIAMLK